VVCGQSPHCQQPRYGGQGDAYLIGENRHKRHGGTMPSQKIKRIIHRPSPILANDDLFLAL
jgi:hypothetical protein